MAHDKTTVRNILDKVKSEGRTSLTAPEGKLVCDAYGIPVPQEGVAKSAADKLATADDDTPAPAAAVPDPAAPMPAAPPARPADEGGPTHP